jgi:PPK2 family polyphosphate:nucleotide phosphotransferase
MQLDDAVIGELKVHPGHSARLGDRSTDSVNAEWLEATAGRPKDVATEELNSIVDQLKASQELLWASDTHSLLLIIQGMDASGKDGTIKHVMSGVNPQGCEVTSFKQPSTEELGHDFLWRYSKALPERGRIGIFNRSYFEEVLVVRVHPELLDLRRPSSQNPSSGHVWLDRFEEINAFEHHLHRDGTRIVKIFLHLSRDRQKKRLLERLADPEKSWKYSPSDLTERQYWDQYQSAYEEAITATSTPWAPWYIVPADHKYEARALVGAIVVDAIDSLDLHKPKLGPEQRSALERAKAELLAD